MKFMFMIQFVQVFGADRQASVSREISKVHEECRRGTLQELNEYYAAHEPKGEIVIVVAGCTGIAADSDADTESEE